MTPPSRRVRKTSGHMQYFDGNIRYDACIVNDCTYLLNKAWLLNGRSDKCQGGSGQRRSKETLRCGWYCFDYISCQARWVHTPHLMSSEHWPDRRKGSGILSWDPEENPFLFNANLVYVPYCSSDTWSGTYKARHRGEFSYMGALIIEEVVKDLVTYHGMSSATKLYLAGSSAGGTGVLVNLDRVSAQMSLLAPRVELRGISDSGWFLDNKQYNSIECVDAHSCAPTDGVEKGIILWQGSVPESCKSIYPEREQWKCYFGYRIYSTLKTPVFVVQHLFDEAQITADNVGPPIKKEQWQYIHNIGKDMKQTMMNVSAVFAPACLSHILLTRSEWHRISVQGVTLPDALKCWEDGKYEQNLYEKPTNTDEYQDLVYSLITGERPRRRERPLGDDPGNKRRKGSKSDKKRDKSRRRRRRRRKKEKQRKRQKELAKGWLPMASAVFKGWSDTAMFDVRTNTIMTDGYLYTLPG
ncbi:hypothetical protein LSH36_1096g00010 [Paralvinella palmiformis]|uniref:Uncharacterized protein n=1 Tax=Paralvinella palmiformis TaxID=53620 RepID=A0AAD9MQ93_9ANNE|nr:hypothetical protein LSH36_1096g00010 [Paralvinella palmiformis]